MGCDERILYRWFSGGEGHERDVRKGREGGWEGGSKKEGRKRGYREEGIKGRKSKEEVEEESKGGENEERE